MNRRAVRTHVLGLQRKFKNKKKCLYLRKNKKQYLSKLSNFVVSENFTSHRLTNPSTTVALMHLANQFR